MPHADPDARRAYARAWYARNAARINGAKQTAEYRAKRRAWYDQSGRDRRRLMRQGVTPEQVEALFDAQGCRCAICRTDDPGRVGWNVDHDHRTGRVRGVLCSPCNRAIGYLKDDPAVVRAAAAYLER